MTITSKALDALETVLILPTGIQWTGIEDYTTKGGKTKQILTGIPSTGFWNQWRHNKELLKLAGVTLKAGKKEATGSYRLRKGKQMEVKSRDWQVIVWVNKLNRPLLAEKGWDVYGLPYLASDATMTQAIDDQDMDLHESELETVGVASSSSEITQEDWPF